MLQSQASGANPLIQLTMFGRGLVSTVTAVWLGGAIFSLIILAATGWGSAMSPVASAIKAFLMWFLPMFVVILVLMFTTGSMLGYYLPLIPMIVFVFGGIGWFIACIEAMVAAPLVAIGIAHPEGSDIFGKSDPAVMLLLNVFLRPSMMIFGFIGGIILSYIGIWLLNASFLKGISGLLVTVQGGSPSIGPIAFIAMLIIYTLIAVAVVQKAFDLIYIIPDKVLRWLQGGFSESLGAETAGRMEQAARSSFTAGAGRVGGAIGEGVSGGLQSGGHGKKAGAGPSGDKKPKEPSSAAEVTTGDKTALDVGPARPSQAPPPE